MKLRTALALAAGVGLTAVASLTSFGRQSTAELHVGDPAPPFSLPGSDGTTYQLADFKGKRAVVLAWFPKAFTGG
jgi:peroxiredoxin Q/BCP